MNRPRRQPTLEERFPFRAWLLTTVEVATRLQRDHREVVRLCRSGELSSIVTTEGQSATRVGWRWIWRYDLERYLKARHQRVLSRTA